LSPRQKRGNWYAIELDGTLTMVHPGWTNDQETLGLALREEGVFDTTYQAYQAAESAILTWGWIGTDDSGALVRCDSDGEYSDGEADDVTHVTLAVIPGFKPESTV
jgi:hypothetical protein